MVEAVLVWSTICCKLALSICCSPWGVLFISLIILLAASGGAFVGGYFLGKSQERTYCDSKPSTNTSTFQHRGLLLSQIST